MAKETCSTRSDIWQVTSARKGKTISGVAKADVKCDNKLHNWWFQWPWKLQAKRNTRVLVHLLEVEEEGRNDMLVVPANGKMIHLVLITRLPACVYGATSCY